MVELYLLVFRMLHYLKKAGHKVLDLRYPYPNFLMFKLEATLKHEIEYFHHYYFSGLI